MIEEKCKQYIKSDGLNFCMSSVCPKKDCIYALVNKLYQTFDCLEKENNSLQAQLNNITVQSNNAITALEQENKELKKEKEMLQKQNDEECLRVTNLAMENTKLEKENKELKEKAPMKLIAKNNRYRFALEDIRNYCDRIEQGSVIGTQDCLINSIKNIINYTINEVLNEGK